MADSLPPIPYKVQMARPDGFVSEPWGKFFRQLFQRVGGNIALTNTELANLPALQLTATNARVTTLEGEVGTINTNISTLNSNITSILSRLDDIGQGPYL